MTDHPKPNDALSTTRRIIEAGQRAEAIILANRALLLQILINWQKLSELDIPPVLYVSEAGLRDLFSFLEPLLKQPELLAAMIETLQAEGRVPKTLEDTTHPQPSIQVETGPKGRFRLSSIGTTVLKELRRQEDPGKRAYLRHQPIATRRAIISDMQRIALHRVGMPVGKWTSEPSDSAESFIALFNLRDPDAWSAMVQLFIDVEYIDESQRDSYLDPSTSPFTEVDLQDTEPDRSYLNNQDGYLTSAAKTLLIDAAMVFDPTIILARAVGRPQLVRQFHKALEAVFAYLDYIMFRTKLPEEMIGHTVEIFELCRAMKVLKKQPGQAMRWFGIIIAAYDLKLIEVHQYRRYTGEGTKLTASDQLCEFLIGVLDAQIDPPATLMDAGALFYESRIGPNWKKTVTYVLNLRGDPESNLAKAIMMIKEAIRAEKPTEANRGFLHYMIYHLTERLFRLKSSPERMNALYPDGLDTPVQQLYDALRLGDELYWNRYINFLMRWEVLWPNEAQRYLGESLL